MFIKIILYVCSILPICVWSQSPEQTSSQTNHDYNELSQIDRQIQELKKQLHHYYVIEMREDVEGQGLMIADWEGYRREMEDIRKLDEEEYRILKQIEKLEQQKTQLKQHHKKK